MNNTFRKIMAIMTTMILMCSILAGCQQKEDTPKEEKTVKEKTYDYVDNSYIVDANWLAKNLKNDKVLILDARSDKDYNKGHIPGAINVAWQGFSNMKGKPGDKGWGVVLDAKELSKKLSEIGITNDKTVVVYADTKIGWGEDGRFVWMLRMAGVQNSKMLDGGFNYWEENKFDISKESVSPQKSDFNVATLNMDTTIDTNELKNDLKNVKIIDTRDKKEYDGATDFGEARGGHIPGAINLPFKNLLNEDGTLKNSKEIIAILDKAKIKKDDKIVTYCTAGIRSAHMQVVLKMVGYNNSKNYDESFYTWAKDNSLEVVVK